SASPSRVPPRRSRASARPTSPASPPWWRTARSTPGRFACGSPSPCRSACTSSMAAPGAKTREVIDGVVQVFLPLPMRPSIVNVYLVRAGDSWTLVDTGMNTEASVAAFRGALAEVGIPPTAITRLIGTHHHVDHYGTSGPYRELTHAEVFLPPLEAERATVMGHVGGEPVEYMRRHGVPDVPEDKRLPSPSKFFGTFYRPTPPDHLLGDEDDIPLGDGRSLEVIWTPGHTPGHCCLLLKPAGILLVGHHLLPPLTPHLRPC